MAIAFRGVKLLVIDILPLKLKSKNSKLFKSISTLAKLYLLLEMLKLILFMNLNALTTWALLTCPNF